jgi:hypothetical protein
VTTPVNDTLDLWRVLQGVLSLLLTLLGFFAVRSLRRLDYLEKKSVTRDEFDKEMEKIRTERVAMHEENKEYLTRIERKIDIAAIARTDELTRANRRAIVEMRKWKHLVVDPYIPGAVDALKAEVERLDRKVDPYIPGVIDVLRADVDRLNRHVFEQRP